MGGGGGGGGGGQLGLSAALWDGPLYQSLTSSLVRNGKGQIAHGKERTLDSLGKVSVVLPPDDWFCQKLEKLNLEVVEGYHTQSPDLCGWKVNLVVMKSKFQSKWYDMHSQETESPH